MSSFCLHFDNSTGVPVCLPYTLAGGTCYSSTIDAILRRVVDSVFDVFVPVFNSKSVNTGRVTGYSTKTLSPKCVDSVLDVFILSLNPKVNIRFWRDKTVFIKVSFLSLTHLRSVLTSCFLAV
jgi:hypothetical protein